MSTLSVKELLNRIWEQSPKVPFESVELGTIVLVREIVGVEEFGDGDDEEEQPVKETVPIATEAVYSVVIPFSTDLSKYKWKGKGYLCSVVGGDRPSIESFRDTSEDDPADRIVRKCVILFDRFKATDLVKPE